MNEMRYQLDLLKAMNQKLTAKDRMYHLICDTVSCAFLYYSFDKNELTTLGKWRDFFDFEIREVKEISQFFDAVEDAYALPLLDVIFLEKNHQSFASIECYMKDKKAWYSFSTQVLYDEEDHPTDKVICIENITKSKVQNEELTYMAYYDGLTGLYNRNYFVRLLGEHIRRAEEENNVVSVMIIDIDDFRKINDGQGIIVGDELVQQLGSFLKELCNDKVMVCHLNSDIYCLAIYSPTGNCGVETVIRQIQERTKQPFRLSSGQELKITVSIGVAEYPEAATTPLELLNCAEIVMYKGKAMGKNIVQYYNAAILDDFLYSVELDKKLKEAVFNQNFEIHFQPQFYSTDKRLRGAEALIRWRDTTGNTISPAVFIPVAEKNGTIVSIGNWVVEQSVKQYMEWKKQYGIDFILSINISALQYSRDDFVDNLVAILNKYEMDSNCLELEITESVLIENFKSVSDKLKVLKSYGIRVSLDDFGTGFSSLSYLMRLPIDTLKIDKSFIDTVLTDHATQIITESIIDMVKALGFESIAEGVEDERQFQYLHDVGCDVIQGYLLGRPMPPEQMEHVLEQAERQIY
ncbi:MAG: bifunctional diguanylate cyclase/phosphodiesterase [Lachnospiraceae bacterium]|nr:bifunctional diguanylate cyclase/phosphodiesterase [Lachnospiraceae bacterium]